MKKHYFTFIATLTELTKFLRLLFSKAAFIFFRFAFFAASFFLSFILLSLLDFTLETLELSSSEEVSSAEEVLFESSTILIIEMSTYTKH